VSGRHLILDIAERLWPLVVLEGLIVIAAFTATSPGDETLDRAVVTALINLILVVGLYTFVGLSGVFSFGHIAFMAIGAYVAGLLTIPVDLKGVLLPGLPGFVRDTTLTPLLATLCGGLVAALVAALLAIPLSRLAGLTAGLGTFAILIIVNVVASNWQGVTGGDIGISPIPTTTTMHTALAYAAAVVLLAFAFQQSRWGLRLRASREDEVAAEAVGIAVGRERALAFVASAFFMGIGGAIFGQFQGSISPQAFYISITFLTIAMLVVGGIKSLSGAVVGVLVLSTLAELLRHVEQGVDLGLFVIPARYGVREVGFAVVMLAILLTRPRGITGGREIRWPLGARRPRFSRRESASSASDVDEEVASRS
jgi:branched-chain amino acid transport system permease protein